MDPEGLPIEANGIVRVGAIGVQIVVKIRVGFDDVAVAILIDTITYFRSAGVNTGVCVIAVGDVRIAVTVIVGVDAVGSVVLIRVGKFVYDTSVAVGIDGVAGLRGAGTDVRV